MEEEITFEELTKAWSKFIKTDGKCMDKYFKKQIKECPFKYTIRMPDGAIEEYILAKANFDGTKLKMKCRINNFECVGEDRCPIMKK